VDVVIADDGLQHLALYRDVEIAVQDSRGCGNGWLLPAGPLREPARRLDRVDFLITQLDADTVAHTTTGAEPDRAHQTQVVQSRLLLHPAVMQHLASGRQLPFADWLVHHGDAPVSAVAGIGVPQRFFQMLRCADVRLERTIALADHDDYRHRPFAQLSDTPILVTPKDAVKCAHLQDSRLWVVHPRAEFSNPSWLDVLDGRLRHIRWQRNHA